MTGISDSGKLKDIPLDFWRTYRLIPIREENGKLFIGVVEPENRKSIDALFDRLGKGFEITFISENEFQDKLNEFEQSFQGQAKKGIRLGQFLLERNLISSKELETALEKQRTTGDRLGQVLIGSGRINHLALSQALAAQFGMAHINLRTNLPDPEIAKLIEPETARDLGALPVRMQDGQLVMAITDPTRLEMVKQKIDSLIPGAKEYHVTSEFDIEWVTRRLFHEEYMRETIWGLFYRSPQESAYKSFSPGQIITLILIAAVLVGSFILNSYLTLLIINAIIAVIYFVVSVFRFWVAVRGASSTTEFAVSPEEVAAINDAELPVYTILVPVFMEKSVLPRLLRSLDNLDYPKSKLDVKLLLEEVDEETRLEAMRMNPPAYIEFITIPDAQPRTKPKACNYGLISARGKYLVIFDAEDRPEPDQLKKVITVYNKSPENLVCVQARLNYYNRNQNFLTRWFTCEYSNWFDMVLPGLDREKFPIPLGGTSNHFVTEKLRELGGWDPFNVTEDADLGVRMYKYNYQTVVVNSTTYEEANSQLWNWIRQRTRWVKGYMQTWLVDMRQPFKLLRELGLKGFFGFHMTVGGTPFLFIINPIFWLLTTLFFVFRESLLIELFPPLVFVLSSINLIIGNFVFVYLNLISAFRRGYYELGRYALLSPIYWVLMSVASWRALWQLIVKPSHWEKTTHGLFNEEDIEDVKEHDGRFE
jgi:glycosyltransferase XagB